MGDDGGVSEPILTVGHSTHPIEELIDLLRGAGVTDVVDVRKLPGSRRNPQFDRDALAAALAGAGIGYRREERLGGRRGASRDVAPDVNGLWRNASFHRYADHALGDDFRAGLAEVVALARSPQPDDAPRRIALMCAEAVWWRCHRRIIADHLLARGVEVLHLMPEGRLVPATPTAGARVADGTVEYPARPEAEG